MTSTAKHTPGPWGISQLKEIFDNALVIYRLHEDGYKGHIVTHLCDPANYQKCKNFTPEEQMANAHLIAAAPELLRAAKLTHEACRVQANLLSTATQEERDRFISHIYEICNDFAYPAIAKAEAKCDN
jgi:hypothetical protein